MTRHVMRWFLVPWTLLAAAAAGCGDSGNGCPAGLTKCGNLCVDTTNNVNHCGACDRSCMGGQFCEASECKSCNNECTSGQRRCAPGTSDQFQECVEGGNGCLVWGTAQACGTGEICDTGTCLPACTDECDPAEKECAGNGWRECGNFDADVCREWSEVTACGVDESCDEASATCIKVCSDDCFPEGENRCIPDVGIEGIESCGNYDADACLEWGNRMPCPAGQTCDGQTATCSSTCTDDCAQGQQVCESNGYRVCGHYDADPCLDWSGITPCASWETCNPATGVCEVSCTDECTTEGDRRCATDGYDVCGRYDPDPCLEWGAHTPCPSGTKCDGGQCVEDCQDDCMPAGSRLCDGNGFHVCVSDHDSDSCLEWGALIPCDANEVCSSGVCLEQCIDECDDGDRECFGNGWRECIVQADPDCNIWSQVTACAADEICDSQTTGCVPICIDECGTEGARQCYANGWRECGYTDADPCLDWSPVNPCGVGQICDSGTATCVDDCSNECNTTGDRECYANGWRECGDHDPDSCLEWSAVNPCGAGQTCSNGECTDTCTDECSGVGVPQCDGLGGFRVCGQFDGDTCLDLSGITYCAYNEECQAGACVEICQEECGVGERGCDGNGWRECGDFDFDPCLEWSTTTQCGASQVCYQGQCVDNLPTVLINEILYDDESTDGEFVFVELWGPGSTSLDDYAVVGINGNGGTQYMSIDLTGYVIPDDGHFVIAHPSADQQLLGVADLIDSRADLQNGPDSVQLLRSGQVIDALGYEDHSGGEVFLGEGSPAPDASFSGGIMYCLSRGADHADSDDNSVDFMLRTMCTPGWEGPGAILWTNYVYGGTSTPAVDSLGNIFTVDSWGWPFGTANDGSTLFNLPLPDPDEAKSSIAIAWDEATLYVGSTNGLYALDPASGSPLWAAPASPGCEVHSTPAVDPDAAPYDGAIYFGTRCDTFVAAYPDGTVKWSYPTSGAVDSSPLRMSLGGAEYVVFGVATGDVVCLDATDGSWVWSASAGGACNGSPANGSDGTVYIGCDDGFLRAFDGVTGAVQPGFPVGIVGVGASTTLVEGCSPSTAPGSAGLDYIFTTSHADDGNIWIYLSDGSLELGGTFPYTNMSSVTIAADSTWLVHTANTVQAYTLLGNLEWYAVLDDSLDPLDFEWIASSPTIGPLSTIVYVVEWKGTLGGGYLHAIQGSSQMFEGPGSYPKFHGDWWNSGWGF